VLFHKGFRCVTVRLHHGSPACDLPQVQPPAQEGAAGKKGEVGHNLCSEPSTVNIILQGATA
jgi:hypothetical protein